MLGTATAGADGSWTLEVDVPAEIEIGEHAIQVEGTASDGAERSIRATLMIADSTPSVTLPETGSDTSLLNYAILIAALGALFALMTTRSRRGLITDVGDL